MKPSNNMHSYKYGTQIVDKWLGDIDGLKTDVKETIMDRFENFFTARNDCDNILTELGKQDNTDDNGVWSSFKDALDDWLDEHLFK